MMCNCCPVFSLMSSAVAEKEEAEKEEEEEEAGRDHEFIILSKNCDGGSIMQSFSNKGLKP